ncbi:MaoC family dehydratase [Rhodobacter sp. 24-YEA-8]|uniref:MaoC family dehydratase n=1 Tax=Rhodobacter sp. 24-YEA-8 TaxID=1884310 RepID=UPI000896DED9|nr:MaoC family dehydratase [Rhodobacter sp. 24-YEA-8]SED51095.1 Acyl dehydratase [Rhodobacter sp. 24-YEA-8]
MQAETLEALIGTSVTFEKEICETDVLDFARITLDDHPNHTDEAYALENGLGGRIVQGALLVGLMAGASTRYLLKAGHPGVTYGYEKIRFLRSIPLGKTLSVLYTVRKAVPEKSNTEAEVRISQGGDLVCIGTHIAHFPKF